MLRDCWTVKQPYTRRAEHGASKHRCIAPCTYPAISFIVRSVDKYGAFTRVHAHRGCARILWVDLFVNITMVVNVHGGWNFLKREKLTFPLSLSFSLARSVNYALGSIDKRGKERALLKFSRRVSARNCER